MTFHFNDFDDIRGRKNSRYIIVYYIYIVYNILYKYINFDCLTYANNDSHNYYSNNNTIIYIVGQLDERGD